MVYIFECSVHGRFEVKQPMESEHSADCPRCGQPAIRIYSTLGSYYDKPKPLYHKDGSYEEK